MDGANMNAQVGLTKYNYRADVCHLNLQKLLLFLMAVVTRCWANLCKQISSVLPVIH
jgi:hypothetical protein